MRVLFDITHPVNVHFFKGLIRRFCDEGNEVLVTVRDKDVTRQLLDSLEIPYQVISRQQRGLVAMASELLQRNVRLGGVARRFRPDVMVAAEGGVSVAPVGMLLGIPQVVFDQVDLAPLQQLAGLTFARTICTSTSYLRDYGLRHIRFRGFLVQSYLDVRSFRPDVEALRRAGIDPAQPNIVLRLVRWSASHDSGRAAPGLDLLKQTIERLGRMGRVIVSSEQPLPPELIRYANPVPAIHLHSLLASARLVLAEGGTVGVEAGVLGTPAICCNTYDFGYLRALERQYGVIRRAGALAAALEMAETILHKGNARRQWQERATRLFEDTADVPDVLYRAIRLAARARGAGDLTSAPAAPIGRNRTAGPPFLSVAARSAAAPAPVPRDKGGAAVGSSALAEMRPPLP